MRVLPISTHLKFCVCLFIRSSKEFCVFSNVLFLTIRAIMLIIYDCNLFLPEMDTRNIFLGNDFAS